MLPPIVPAGIGLLRRTEKTGPIAFNYGDFVLSCDSSHHLPKILAQLPDFGRNLADIVLALEIDQAHIIDVGANIGDTALLLARFAPGNKVLCIEGDPQFMPYLETNISQITGVTAVRAILSDASGESAGNFVVRHGTAHLELAATGDRILMITLDDLLKNYAEFSTPDLVKIDTDGFDAAILRGAKQVLTSARPVVFYEWHPGFYGLAGERETDHACFLKSLGYTRFIVYTNRGEALLVTEAPGIDIWESLARFSRGRQSVDDWHYDIAAFPDEHYGAWHRLAGHYSKSGIREHLTR